MSAPTPTPAPVPSPASAPPALGSQAHQRKLRNFLLEPRFQLKFTGYIVVMSLVLTVLLGAFLVSSARSLLQEAEAAVEARSRAVEASRSLSEATLNNELLANIDDPAFKAQLDAKSRAIDREYEAERDAVGQQRAELVRRQRLTWWVLAGCLLSFIIVAALASIVATHRIVGPLFRVRRIVSEVEGGHLNPPMHALRESDELQDLFDSITRMVRNLRRRTEDDADAIAHAIAKAEAAGAPADSLDALRVLERQLRQRLGQ